MRPSRRQTHTLLRRWSGARPSVTILAVAGLCGAFVAQWILERFQPDMFVAPGWLEHWLALDWSSLSAHSWWQVLTYGTLHAGLLHLLWNVLLLYFAGRDVESIVGFRHAAGLLLLGQVCGGLAQVCLQPDSSVVGVSAGTAAVVAAFSTILPGLEIRAHLFFIIPVTMRAKYLGLGLAFLGVLGWFTQAVPKAGPAGVFVGCLVGWLYTRHLGFGQPFWFQRIMFERRQREARLERMPADQFIAEEVDPILEKISRTGMGSLTRAERQLLARAGDKMEVKPSRTEA